MSIFDDPEIMGHLKEKYEVTREEKDESKKIIDDKTKQKELVKQMVLYYKEQLKKENINERRTFKDDDGYDILLFKTYEKPITNNEGVTWTDPMPNKNHPEEMTLKVYFPLFNKKDQYPKTMKITMKKGMYYKNGKLSNTYNFGMVGRGELYTTYKYLAPEAPDKPFFEKDFIKYMSKQYNTVYKSIEEIDSDAYECFYTFRIYQILEAKKIG